MAGCCRPTTLFGACLCALIRSIPYISLLGFGCMIMGFLMITANLVPIFDFVRDQILDADASSSFSHRVMNGAYAYYWIVSFISLVGTLFSLFLSLFGTGWVHEQCCGIKRSIGRGPSVCLNFVSSTFMVLQALMVIFFFVLTLLAVLAFTLSVVFAGSREGVRNICNSPPVIIYNRAANITVCKEVYEQYFRINGTDAAKNISTDGSETPDILALDSSLQSETYANSTCLNLKQYNRDLVNIKCGEPFTQFCEQATKTKLRTAAGALVAGTSFFLLSCLLFLASTPANYVRFRQLPEYRVLNASDGGGAGGRGRRAGGRGRGRQGHADEDEEEDWSEEELDDQEDVSPKGGRSARGRGGRAAGNTGSRRGGGGRGRRQQAGGQFSVNGDDDDLEDDDDGLGQGHGAVAVHSVPAGAHAVMVAAASAETETETARLRRAREALEAETDALKRKRVERDEAEAQERIERMRRQLDDEKKQMEVERAALRQQQQAVQMSIATQGQLQQQAQLSKAAGATDSSTETSAATSTSNSVSAM